jgi:hypothetical protein
MRVVPVERTEARSADPMLPLSLFRAPAVGFACLVGTMVESSYGRFKDRE